MIQLTAAEIAEATSGRLLKGTDPATVVSFATTDSREVIPGTLFIAKPGEQTDGYRFVPAALEAGASLCLVERDEKPGTVPGILVSDVVLAMGELARLVIEKLRSDHPVTVAGITGSAGKTTTKDLVQGVLSRHAETRAPIGSYNGEVGVPLTVFRTEEKTRYLVLEMGANAVGNIKYLTALARPDIGVVLCVGTAHAGEFGGVENIARTKAEMVEGLGEEQYAVLNADDPQVWEMRKKTRAKILALTSDDSRSDEELLNDGASLILRAANQSLRSGGLPSFDLLFPGQKTCRVNSQLIGEHHILNLLAAAAVCLLSGIDAEDIASGLSDQKAASRWRMERTDRSDGVSVINDAYNANPESMRAALRALANMAEGRRTWAVLGGMLELGEQSIAEHDQIGRYAVRLNISSLLAVGELARPLYNGAVMEGSWGDEAKYVENIDQAQELLRQQLAPGDIVLFKSSRDSRLRELGDRIAFSEEVFGADQVNQGGQNS